MTIIKLHKILSKAIAEGHGRKLVCVNKLTFTHALEEDGACILPVCAADMDRHEMLDDDGGSKELANRRIATRMAMVLLGGGRISI